MPHCEHWILIQQKLDILVAFSNSILHVSVRPEFMFWTSELVSRDISIVSIFIQIVCPYPCSVFQLDVKVWWLDSHTHLTSWGGQVILCLYFLWLNLEKLFGLTYIIRIPSILQLCMATPWPAMYGRYHVYPLSGFGCGISMQFYTTSIVGWLLLLFVRVWGHI